MDITVIAIDNHREDLLKIQTILKSISKISAKHLCFYISFYDNPKAIVSYECDWFIIGIQLDGVSGFEAAQKCEANSYLPANAPHISIFLTYYRAGGW